MWKRFRSNPLCVLFLGNKVSNISLAVFTLLFNFISTLLEGISFAFILFSFTILSVDDVSNHQSIWIKNLKTIFDQTQMFSFLMLGAVLSQVLRSVFTYFGQMLTVKLTINLQSDAQTIIYQRIFHMTYPSVNRYKIGDLIHYVTTPPTYFRSITEGLNKFIISAMMIVGYIIFMMKLSVSLAICTLILFGTCAFFQKILIKKIINFSQKQTNHMVELNKETAQNLAGLRTIHLFDRRVEILKKVKRMLKNVADSSIRLNKWNQLIQPLNEIIAVVLVATSMILGMIFLKRTQVDLFALLLTFLALTYRLGTRLQAFMQSCGEIAFHMGPILRLREILSNKDKEFIDTKQKPVVFERGIHFDRISLKYPGKNTFAIQDVSLEIKKGTTVAFVGSSGGGKSSLLDLLLRLYEPSEGCIYVDGKPITDFSISSWRNRCGVVSQDIFLFHESIESNIRFGDLNASKERIIEAAQLAGAHDFIEKLPKGYQTTVGEKGYRLSGGEKQRISLARALIRKPEILILDEATSNLDSQSEKHIQGALERLQGKVTMFIVAHRLATINMADQVVVIDHGRITEQGTHQELIQLGGQYHHLWTLQTIPMKEKQLMPH